MKCNQIFYSIAGLICFLIILPFTYSVKYPNDIEGKPEIDCNNNHVRVTVKTTNGMASRIFAKGHYNALGCAFEKTNSATFNIGACGMNRQRQLEPRGVSYGVVIIVQLHPLFVTKVDRAFNLKCFYMEAEKTITSLLHVSMLSTEPVTQGMPMPTCTYELHADNPTGPAARYAKVGDRVWHFWNCPSPAYGMLVHSCYVSDGEGNEFEIIDEKGCGVDQYVIRTPHYSKDLTKVQQETHVFKYADKTALVFNCQIKLCSKVSDGCAGISPPTCAGDTNVTSANLPFNETTTTTVNTTLPSTIIEGINSTNATSRNSPKGNQTTPSTRTTRRTFRLTTRPDRRNVLLNDSSSNEIDSRNSNDNQDNQDAVFSINITTIDENQSDHFLAPKHSSKRYRDASLDNREDTENIDTRMEDLDRRERRNARRKSEENDHRIVKSGRNAAARIRISTMDHDIETDVSQSLWVLEAEENANEGDKQFNEYRNTLIDDSPTSSMDEIEAKSNSLSPSICLSKKILVAIIAPMATILITTIAMCICVFRAKRDDVKFLRSIFPVGIRKISQ